MSNERLVITIGFPNFKKIMMWILLIIVNIVVVSAVLSYEDSYVDRQDKIWEICNALDHESGIYAKCLDQNHISIVESMNKQLYLNFGFSFFLIMIAAILITNGTPAFIWWIIYG